MNTTGIQNYLSNVFRPIYTYDTTASNFTPKLELSNIDTISGNTISVFSAAIGDSASNVYVGSNAGNSYSVLRNCSNVTALGYGAASNISNDSNSVYIGWYAGANGSNGSNVISIGKSSGGNGVDNVFLGTSTGTAGQSNILIGHFIAPSNVSNQIRIGYSNQIPIAADLSKNWIGLGAGTSPTDLSYATIDISGNTYLRGNLGVKIRPGDRTLDVSGTFRAQDASGNTFDFNNAATSSTVGFLATNGVFKGLTGTVNVSNSSVQTIAELKRGMIAVSAQLIGTGGSNYHSRLLYVSDETGSVAPSQLAAVQDGFPFIVFSTSNIQISNSDGTSRDFDYSVTYFPMF